MKGEKRRPSTDAPQNQSDSAPSLSDDERYWFDVYAGRAPRARFDRQWWRVAVTDRGQNALSTAEVIQGYALNAYPILARLS